MASNWVVLVLVVIVVCSFRFVSCSMVNAKGLWSLCAKRAHAAYTQRR